MSRTPEVTLRIAMAVVVAAAGLALAACAETPPEPAKPEPAASGWGPRPGYSGPCPSPEAQVRLRAIHGKPVPVGVAGVTEAGWVFGGFAVVPSDAAPGGKGPTVMLMKTGATREIYVPDDAAVDRLLAEFAKASAPR